MHSLRNWDNDFQVILLENNKTDKCQVCPRIKKELNLPRHIRWLGLKVIIHQWRLEVVKGTKTVLTSWKVSGLYMLEGAYSNRDGGYMLNSEITDIATWKWHLRLGHLEKNVIKSNASTGTLGREPLKEIPFCKECVMSKHHRGKFRKGQRVSTERLEYIHSDLWGPGTQETVGRKM